VHQGEGFEEKWKEIFERVKAGEAMSFIEKILPEPKSRFNWLKKESMRFVSQPEIVSFIESVTPEDEIFPALSELKLPVRLIWSENDELLPFHLSEQWKNGLKENVEVIPLKDRTHMPHLEKPWQVAKVIKQAILN